jgi:hypothetical protein
VVAGDCLMMARLLAGFIVLALKTDILRDGEHLPNGTRLSFSLGRTQMAWWTLIISGSFLYVWMVTQDWTFLIPGSALVLMGISASTALGSQLIDGNRNQRPQALLDRQRTLTNGFSLIAVALRATPLDSALQAQQAQTQSQLSDVNSKLDKLPPDFGPSSNFLSDILSDDDGGSLHRFQNASGP